MLRSMKDLEGYAKALRRLLGDKLMVHHMLGRDEGLVLAWQLCRVEFRCC